MHKAKKDGGADQDKPEQGRGEIDVVPEAVRLAPTGGSEETKRLEHMSGSDDDKTADGQENQAKRRRSSSAIAQRYPDKQCHGERERNEGPRNHNAEFVRQLQRSLGQCRP